MKYHCTVAYHKAKYIAFDYENEIFCYLCPYVDACESKTNGLHDQGESKAPPSSYTTCSRGEKKRVSWHSLIFLCRNESPAFWCCHIHENRVSLPLLRVVIYVYPLVTPNFAKDRLTLVHFSENPSKFTYVILHKIE